MADFHTPNYDLTEPEVGSSSGTWGTKLNSGIGLVDALLARPKPVIAVSNDGAFDMSEAHVHQMTVNADKTVVITNVPEAETDGNPVSSFLWALVINGGAHVVTWPVNVTWLGSGLPPVMPVSGSSLILLVTGDEGANFIGMQYSTDVLVEDSIITEFIIDEAVTTPKIADDAVTPVKMAQSAYAKAVKTNTQVIAGSTPTAVSYETESYDTAAIFSAGSPTRMTVPADWTGSEAELAAEVYMPNNSGGDQETSFWIRKNGSTTIGARTDTWKLAGAGSQILQVVAFDNDPQMGDYYEVMISTQGSGMTLVANGFFRLRQAR